MYKVFTFADSIIFINSHSNSAQKIFEEKENSMKRPHLHISEWGEDYEKYDNETDAYERAQQDAFEREQEEKSKTQEEQSI
jgi:hypothetical protein